MKLHELLVELVELGNTGVPKADALRESFAPRARALLVAGPQLQCAPWANGVRSAADVYLDLDGDVAGLHVWQDRRGWGTYAEIAVKSGTLADVEAVVGRSQPMVRSPDDFTSGARFCSYVDSGGHRMRIFSELAPSGDQVARVTLHFEK